MEIIQADPTKDLSEVARKAAAVLRGGGVIVYPTDTLYGLGANAMDEMAVRRVFDIKRRSYAKPLPVLARNMAWVDELAHVGNKQRKFLEKIWPAGDGNGLTVGGEPATARVTAVLAKKPVIPYVLTAMQTTVGVRIADHKFTDKLLGYLGYPVTATSANISGDEPTRDPNKVIAMFKDLQFQPDLMVDIGILPAAEPSTIVDLTGSIPKILRVGATKPQQLMMILSEL